MAPYLYSGKIEHYEQNSEGIYLLGQDYIVNFVSERRAGEVGAKLSVEVFDRDLRFLGYYELIREEELVSMYRLVQASDGKGRFYLVQRREGVPVVRVITLEITE